MPAGATATSSRPLGIAVGLTMLPMGIARFARSGAYGFGSRIRTVKGSTASTASIQVVMKSFM